MCLKGHLVRFHCFVSITAVGFVVEVVVLVQGLIEDQAVVQVQGLVGDQGLVLVQGLVGVQALVLGHELVKKKL